MPTLSAAPVPSVSARRRGAHALDEPKGNYGVGVAGTLLGHLALAGLFFLLPDDLIDGDEAEASNAGEQAFEIELSPAFAWVPPPLDAAKELPAILKTLPPQPEAEAIPEPKDPVRFFIAANVLAPVDTPDAATFISNQSQQAAQPDAAFASDSPLPVVASDDPNKGAALVTGTQFQNQASVAEQFENAFKTTPHETESVESPEPKLRVEPLAGEKTEVLSGETEAANATKTGSDGAESASHSPQDGVEMGRVDGEGYFAKSQKIDRNRPMPRRRVAQQSLPDSAPYVTIKNLDGTRRIGVLAADARWTEFGDYYGRMWDSIGFEWERNLINSRFLPTRGVHVAVTVRLGRTGAIIEIVKVEGGESELTQLLCVSAITNRAPYGAWTQGMIDLFGESTELTFGFQF